MQSSGIHRCPECEHTKDEIIPGLYAVGTIVGDMFANYYTFMPSGINLGSTCVTFGYLTGKEIANS